MISITGLFISDPDLGSAGRIPCGAAPLALLPRLFRAWLTLEPVHWSRAAESWLACMALFRKNGSALLIASRLLKAAERYEDALLILIRARALSPGDARIPLVMGRLLRALGKRTEAIEALVTAWHMGARTKAGAELCRYGARDSAPDMIGAIYANSKYTDFLAAHPIAAPPASDGIPAYFHVVVDERDATPADVERTVASLSRQSYPPAYIWMHQERHPSMFDAAMDHALWQINLAAGVSLHPQALAWLNFAIQHVDCGTVYADSDHGIVINHECESRGDPVLHPMTDDLWFSDRRLWPVLMASRSTTPISEERVNLPIAYSWDKLPKPVAHVPRILATCFGPTSSESTISTPVADQVGKGRLSLVIPTRDNPSLLEACIESLYATAIEPDRFDVHVVDNGSVQPETKQLFAALERSGKVAEIIPFDEPFNWSRANNIAARRCSGETLIFLNDDTQMLAHGWDSHILSWMMDLTIGVVGARLLYPDRSVQHAGFIFGMDNGPQHEGRWTAENNPGPEQRWCRARQTVAVTGAFMAIRRSLFEQLGPFEEERLAIDFSDIDWCLRARAAGFKILYSPELLLLHHESVSRGFNRSRKKRRRFHREAELLRTRWGRVLDRDPGYNPQWTRQGAPFDGLREPTMEEILDHIAWSRTRDPWTAASDMPKEEI